MLYPGISRYGKQVTTDVNQLIRDVLNLEDVIGHTCAQYQMPSSVLNIPEFSADFAQCLVCFRVSLIGKVVRRLRLGSTLRKASNRPDPNRSTSRKSFRQYSEVRSPRGLVFRLILFFSG